MATKQWSSTTTGLWSTSGNWSPSGPPTATSDVTISTASVKAVTLDTSATINSLTIANTYTLAFAASQSLFVNANVQVNSGGTLTMGTSGDVLSLSGGTGSINDAGQMTIGAGASVVLNTAPLNIASGGTLTVAGLVSINGGNAITMDPGPSADRLILQAGYSFGLLNVVGGGSFSTLELGTGGGELNALGTQFTNFGTVTVDPGVTWTVDVTNSQLTVSGPTINGNTVAATNGTSTLIITSAGAADLSNVNRFATINMAAGGNSVTVKDATLSGGNVTISHSGASGTSTINAAAVTTASATKTLTYVAGNGVDTFTGGNEKDQVNVSAAAVGGDTLTGGSNIANNTLSLTTGGAANLSHVSKFGTINLSTGNAVTVTDTTLSGGNVTIDGTAGNNSIIASSVTTASATRTLTYIVGSGSDTVTGGAEKDIVNASGGSFSSKNTNLTFNAGTGTDTLLGGFENDLVKDDAAKLLGPGGDTLTGGHGNNTLTLTTAGTANLSHVSNFGTIKLMTTGGNTLAVQDATLSGGNVTIVDSTSGNNTVNALGVAASVGRVLTYTVGSGTSDTFIGGAEDNVVNASTNTTASNGNTLTFTAGTGTDTLIGGHEADVVNVKWEVIGQDSFTGGSNTTIGNTLNVTDAGGVVNLAGVKKFGTINLANGTNTVTVTDATMSGGNVTINDNGSAAGSATTVDASTATISAARTLTYSVGLGVDTFTGGSEKDIVQAAAGAVGADTLTGGSNIANNVLNLTSGGTANLAAVSRFGTINLASSATTTVTVKDLTLSTGSVTINDGLVNINNAINAAGVTASPGTTLNYSAKGGSGTFTGGTENDVVSGLAGILSSGTLTGGSGNNTLVLTGTNAVNLFNISKFGTVNLFGGNTANLSDKALNIGAVTINDGTGSNSVVAAGKDTAASAGATLTYAASGAADTFAGGFENDVVEVAAANVGTDTLTGGSGSNTLILTTAGAADLSHVSNFGTINLFAGDTVTLTDATLDGVLVNGVKVTSVTISDTGGNNSIIATGASVSGGSTLTYVAGNGTDSFAGGSESDVVQVAAGRLLAANGDTLDGGGGSNTLTLTTGGGANLSHVSNFNVINLNATGGSVVTLTDTTLSGNVTIKGVAGNNTIDASSALTASTLLTYVVASGSSDTFTGGAENDTVNATSGSKNKTLTFNTGTGTDKLFGGSENDLVKEAAAKLQAGTGDTLVGSSTGNNTLTLTTGGAANLSNVSNFGTINLASAGNATVTVAHTTLSGGAVTIRAAAGSTNVVSAVGDSTVGKTLTYLAAAGSSDTFFGGGEDDVISGFVGTASVGKTLNFTTSSGTDTLTGGSEFDVVNTNGLQVSRDFLTGGSAANTLNLTDAGAASATLAHVSKFGTINLGTAGLSTVSLAAATLSIGAVTINDRGNGNLVNASGDGGVNGASVLTYVASGTGDTFIGGFETDVVQVAVASLPGDTLTGGTNANNELDLMTSGAADLSHVTRFGTIKLLGGGANAITVADTTLSGGAVTIVDSSFSNTIVSTASASAGTTLTFQAGSGADSFTGNSENDVVIGQLAQLTTDSLIGGTGSNTITVTDVGGSGNLFSTKNFGTVNLAGGNTVMVGATTLSSAAVTINDAAGVGGGSNIVIASTGTAGAGKTLTYAASNTSDTFTGGGENDLVKVAAGNLGGDSLTGGSGANTLALTTVGAVDLSHVSNFGAVNLLSGANTVTVTHATLSGGAVTINDIGGNNIIDASGATGSAGKTLTYAAGNGTDTFTGGTENDVIQVSAGRLLTANGDTLTGGSGSNTLTLTAGGAANLSHVSGFGVINLNAAGDSPVTVTDTTLSGNVTIKDGTGGNNVIVASGVTSASAGKTLTYIVGSGSDTFTGGAEKDIIDASTDAFTTPPRTLTYNAGTGKDVLIGGFENDAVKDDAAKLVAIGGDTLTGGTGVNTLTLTTTGSADLSHVSKFGTINLATGGNTVTVAANTLSGGTVTIHGSGGSVVSAVGDTGASTGKTLTYTVGTGTGAETFSGAFENDVIIGNGAASGKTLTVNLLGSGTATLIGGAELDAVTVSAAGIGGDTLTGGSNANNSLSLNGGGLARLNHVSKFSFINLTPAGNTVTLADATLLGGTVTIFDVGGGNNSVIASADTAASGSRTLNYMTGSGTDTFIGGFEKDVVQVDAAKLSAVGGDTLTGGGNANNTVMLTTGGAANLSHVTNFGSINLSSVGGNTVTVTDAALSTGTLTVSDGHSGNTLTVTDTGVSAGTKLVYAALSGGDTFTGGRESDTVRVTSATLSGDHLHGGSTGNDILVLTDSNTTPAISGSTVDGFESYVLSAGGNNLTLLDANYNSNAAGPLVGGAIHVFASNATNTLNAGALSSGNKLVYSGGTGADTIITGFGGATMTGGTGAANIFTFAHIGTNTITDFGSVAGNELVFSSTGFSLGDGVAASPTALPGAQIGDLTTGAFTSATQRFAYNKSNGQLLYDADGNGAGASQVIATLNGNPTVTAGQLFFVT